MRRFRLSTLMLLIVLAALGIALVVHYRRAARREVELQARLEEENRQLKRARVEVTNRVVVTRDVCASMNGSDYHEAALKLIEAALGWIIDSDEIIAALQPASAA